PPPTRIWISDPLHGGRWLDDVLTANGVDMTGWQLDELVGISDDGTRLAGNGTAPSGQRQGWYAVLPDLAEK
ncbi:MAG TPA: hypothetical protein VMW35_02715, partial [Myxococcota bacterium]|nr:hypothetical protein [Myxococcota bacterium]